MTDLLPCPFCGGKAELHEDPFEEWTSYVQCGSCYLRTAEHFNSESAAKYWNTRPSPWIPCAERMPEPQTVCIISNGKFVAAAYPFMLDRGYAESITHWMPLPEPPEVEP